MQKYQPIPNAACLVAACRELSIPYTFYDDHHDLIGVSLDREYFFANASTPFNDEAIAKICKDKEFMYRIVHSVIRMPRTVGFIDPDCNPDYQSYVTFSTHKKIVERIEKVFSYPIIVKMNSGSRGINVFKCDDRSSVKEALKTIYNKGSQYYDYVALAQEYVPIEREFRVITFQGNAVLVYEKDFPRSVPVIGNISPLHQENSKAILVTDPALIKRLSEFVTPLLKKTSIVFAGFDIMIDDKNALWVIELNSKPGFEYFVRDNGHAHLIEMYRKILVSLMNS